MKTLITLLLAALMAWTPVYAQTQTQTNTAPPAAQKEKVNDSQVLLCLLYLSGAVAAGWVIWKVYSNLCGDRSCENKRLILERSHYDGNWVPIATNDVSGVCTNPIEVFRTKITDDSACYRVRIVDIPPHLLP